MILHTLRKTLYTERMWINYCLKRWEREQRQHLCPACGKDEAHRVIDCFDDLVGSYQICEPMGTNDSGPR